ncbi:MAG: aminopeptidase P family protein [Clostridiales bacterium]|nr:aminopeptidase P family protein [Clostridiales bacterium]
MTSTTHERISALRSRMLAEDIAATIIPQTDPHQSEYLASHWQVRRWLSGFTGSAGTLVVTATDARMWVDSRYFIQASQQLEGSGIKLMKIAVEGTPTISEFINQSLKAGDNLGIDGMLFSATEYKNLRAELNKSINIDTDFDPARDIWTDRPPLPARPIILNDLKYAGVSASKKLSDLRAQLQSIKADAMLISALDEIAWLLNIRSTDVRCNPVATCYLLVEQNDCTLFIQPEKITEEAAAYFKALGIKAVPYDSLIASMNKTSLPVIAIDPATTSARIIETLGDRSIYFKSPIPLAKSIKNEVEIQGFRQAMTNDGIALTKGFMELEKKYAAGEKITELTVCETLHRYRAEQPLFFDESFGTIAGYGPHGAIVHYEPTPDSDATIGPDSLLLIDSGAQYLNGTTDITRTIIFGEPSEKQRLDFTTVLKGNIDLAMAIFPTGTRGTQLDALAHTPLWKKGYNYLHGTGHGVGHFLNVHEGPQSIRTNENPVALQAGMTITDEPGLYLEGSYGIRCENTLLVIPAISTPSGEFLKFESLTLFPFQLKLIDSSMLDDDEITWLNNYHNRVYNTLKSRLNEEEQAWLRKATLPIDR